MLPAPVSIRSRPWRWACRRHTSRDTAWRPTSTTTRSVCVVRPGRLAADRQDHAEVRCALPDAVLEGHNLRARPATRAPSRYRPTGTTWRPASRRRGTSRGDRTHRRYTAAFGLFFDNHITGTAAASPICSRVTITSARWCGTFPASLPRMERAGPSTAGDRRGPVPVAQVLARSGTRNAVRAPCVGWRRSANCRDKIAVSATSVYARGFNQVGTIDYNPWCPRSAPDAGPRTSTAWRARRPQFCSTPRSARPGIDGLTVSLARRLRRHQLLVSYTLSKAEDNSTDFQSAFIPQQNGRGRDPDDVNGLPVGFDPHSERGPSMQDQRHRFVDERCGTAPGGVQLSRRSSRSARAGRTRFSPAPTSMATATAARFRPTVRAATRAARHPASDAIRGRCPRRRWSICASAAVSALAGRHDHRADLRGVQPLQPHELHRNQQLSPAFIWGTGAYPASPLPAFGRFTQAGPPRQVQLAVKVAF